MSHSENENCIYRGNRSEIILAGTPEGLWVEKRLLSFADVSPERAALFQEALMQRRAEGPGVIPVYAPSADQLAQKELRSLKRPYIPGLTLRERREAGPCTREETAAILCPVLKSLARLHSADAGRIIHRDLTPGNIIIDRDARIWLNDFGLARDEASSPLPPDESLQGTRRYLPPELLDGEQPTTGGDIFQSALLACFLLASSPPNPPLDPEERKRWARALLSPLGLEACVASCPEKRPSAAQAAGIWERFLA